MSALQQEIESRESWWETIGWPRLRECMMDFWSAYQDGEYKEHDHVQQAFCNANWSDDDWDEIFHAHKHDQFADLGLYISTFAKKYIVMNLGLEYAEKQGLNVSADDCWQAFCAEGLSK